MATTHLPVPLRLPAPVTAHWDWQTAAACRGMDTDQFFHPPKEHWRRRQRRVAAAQTICNTCPVIQQCLEHALKVREPYGIWGGRSEEERATMLGLRSLRYPAPANPPASH